MGSAGWAPLLEGGRYYSYILLCGILALFSVTVDAADSVSIAVSPANVKVGDPFNVTCVIRLEHSLRLSYLYHEIGGTQSEVLTNAGLNRTLIGDKYERYNSHGVEHKVGGGVNFTFGVEAAFLRDGGLYTCVALITTTNEREIPNSTVTILVTGTETDEERYELENIPTTTTTTTTSTRATTTLVATVAQLSGVHEHHGDRAAVDKDLPHPSGRDRAVYTVPNGVFHVNEREHNRRSGEIETDNKGRNQTVESIDSPIGASHQSASDGIPLHISGNVAPLVCLLCFLVSAVW